MGKYQLVIKNFKKEQIVYYSIELFNLGDSKAHQKYMNLVQERLIDYFYTEYYLEFIK